MSTPFNDNTEVGDVGLARNEDVLRVDLDRAHALQGGMDGDDGDVTDAGDDDHPLHGGDGDTGGEWNPWDLLDDVEKEAVGYFENPNLPLNEYDWRNLTDGTLERIGYTSWNAYSLESTSVYAWTSNDQHWMSINDSLFQSEYYGPIEASESKDAYNDSLAQSRANNDASVDEWGKQEEGYSLDDYNRSVNDSLDAAEASESTSAAASASLSASADPAASLSDSVGASASAESASTAGSASTDASLSASDAASVSGSAASVSGSAASASGSAASVSGSAASVSGSAASVSGSAASASGSAASASEDEFSASFSAASASLSIAASDPVASASNFSNSVDASYSNDASVSHEDHDTSASNNDYDKESRLNSALASIGAHYSCELSTIRSKLWVDNPGAASSLDREDSTSANDFSASASKADDPTTSACTSRDKNDSLESYATSSADHYDSRSGRDHSRAESMEGHSTSCYASELASLTASQDASTFSAAAHALSTSAHDASVVDAESDEDAKSSAASRVESGKAHSASCDAASYNEFWESVNESHDVHFSSVQLDASKLASYNSTWDSIEDYSRDLSAKTEDAESTKRNCKDLDCGGCGTGQDTGGGCTCNCGGCPKTMTDRLGRTWTISYDAGCSPFGVDKLADGTTVPETPERDDPLGPWADNWGDALA